MPDSLVDLSKKYLLTRHVFVFDLKFILSGIKSLSVSTYRYSKLFIC